MYKQTDYVSTCIISYVSIIMVEHFHRVKLSYGKVVNILVQLLQHFSKLMR